MEDRSDERAVEELERTWSRPPGLRGYLAAVNNQPIGRRFMLTSLTFFAIGGVLALLMRIQLAVSENEWLDPDTFNALFTMHGSTMMYLFAVPFLEGLALYMMPMMIGSRDVAFPRLTAFSYWMYLSGGLIMYASFFFGTVPDAGWFAYTPLSGPEFADKGLDFWLLGLGLVEVAGITAGAEIVVTILKMRAAGMALHRMPLLVWSFLVAGVMILFGFTPLFMATVLLELDRTLGTHFFNTDAGGSSLLWQHLFWFFGHPEVYIIFIPATGVVSSVVPVFARRPIVGYTLVVVALMVTGFVSFGLWVHHMFTTGLPQLSLIFFAGASFMIALASGTQVFAWVATLWASRPSYQTPLLYVLGFLFIFVLGGITGVMVATIPFDMQVHDSYFIVAHFHYVLIGGAVFPILAGIYYWFPKFSGRAAMEPWGKIGFWLVFIGFNVTFFPMHHMGMFGMPRRVYTYSAELGLDTENMIATIGAFVLAAGFVLAFGMLIVSVWRGRRVDNPWNGGTLEWSIPSPPPSFSFREPPVVHHRDPLWVTEPRDADAEALQKVVRVLREGPTRWRATLVTDAVSGRPQVLQRLPGPTLVPLVTAAGWVLTAVAVLVEGYILAVAAAVFSAGMIGYWLKSLAKGPGDEEVAIAKRAGLSPGASASESLGWWGAVCLVTVLAVALGSVVYAYFYLSLYSEEWPQGGIGLPRLLWPSVVYGLLLGSGGVMFIASRGWGRGSGAATRGLLAAALALGVAFLGVQLAALATAGVAVTENAYTSAFFVVNGLVLLYAATGAALLGMLVWRVSWRGESHAAARLHMEVALIYWLFVVAAGAVGYLTTYVSPHVL